MSARPQILAIVVSVVLFGLIFELVRRRKLMERYSILWLLSAGALLLLSVWRGLLERFADTVGIAYAPSALFLAVLGSVLVLLLHFSLVISRLADQNKVLAQRLGLLQQRVEQLEDEPAAAARLPAAREAVPPEPAAAPARVLTRR